MPKWDPWSDEEKRDKDQSHKWGSYEPERARKRKKNEKSHCSVELIYFLFTPVQ